MASSARTRRSAKIAAGIGRLRARNWPSTRLARGTSRSSMSRGDKAKPVAGRHRADPDLKRDQLGLERPGRAAFRTSWIRRRSGSAIRCARRPLPAIGGRRCCARAARPDRRAQSRSRTVGGSASGCSRGHDGDDALLQRHQRLEVGQERRAEHQRKIDLVVGQRRHRLLVIEHLDLEADRADAACGIRRSRAAGIRAPAPGCRRCARCRGACPSDPRSATSCVRLRRPAGAGN